VSRAVVIIGLIVGAAALATVAGAIWFRMVPDDAETWHVDPLTAPPIGTPNAWRSAPADAPVTADAEAPVFAVTPEALLEAFDRVALGQPRTERIAGSVDELHATYVQRSAVMGFPDYISVVALPAQGGATLAILSRSRYGRDDFGVNRKRVSAWLEILARTLG
jgi:uncharacterized protein (DUF1499 family)